MTSCSTDGCEGEVTLFDGAEPLCRACREAAIAADRESDRLTCCVHLGSPRDEWLERYGTPEGREAWLASQVRLYGRVLSGPNAGRERAPKEARAAARAHWRSLRADSLRHLPRARSCEIGLGGRAVARVLHTDVLTSPGGGVAVRHQLSTAVCDRQACCRAYAAAMNPDNDGGVGSVEWIQRRVAEDEPYGGDGNCTAGGSVARHRRLHLADPEDGHGPREQPTENADVPPHVQEP